MRVRACPVLWYLAWSWSAGAPWSEKEAHIKQKHMANLYFHLRRYTPTARNEWPGPSLPVYRRTRLPSAFQKTEINTAAMEPWPLAQLL